MFQTNEEVIAKTLTAVQKHLGQRWFAPGMCHVRFSLSCVSSFVILCLIPIGPKAIAQLGCSNSPLSYGIRLLQVGPGLRDCYRLF
jgi:hypothetical protein